MVPGDTLKERANCSNRTFMELKWGTRENIIVRKVVLIVPLWN